MSENGTSKKDQTSRITPKSPWRIQEFSIVRPWTFSLKFMDGLEGEYSLENFLSKNEIGVFKALREEAFFNQVYLEYGVLTWPGELDLAPDTIYWEIRNSTSFL